MYYSAIFFGSPCFCPHQHLLFQLEVIDPETELLTGQDMDADLGVEGSEKELTVTGLLPYTNYSLVLSVHNTEHSASSPPWTQMTAAAR